MKNYLELMYKILTQGNVRSDRTGTGTLSLFGEQLRFDLQKSFPIVTTKYTWFKGIKEELYWMLKGGTNIKPLNCAGVHIWDAWANSEGELGPVYGKQWRNWDAGNGVCRDQVFKLLKDLKENPMSRRHILSSWNVADLDDMALEPCHVMCQFYVEQEEYDDYTVNNLSCHMYQRSCDYFLGAPFNIAQYALLTEAICLALSSEAYPLALEPKNRVHWTAKELIISYGDVHIYTNHINQCKTQLGREPIEDHKTLNFPIIDCKGDSSVDRLLFAVKNLELFGYKHHPAIKGDISV